MHETFFLVRGSDIPEEFIDHLRRSDTLYQVSASSMQAMPDRALPQGLYTLRSLKLPENHRGLCFDLFEAAKDPCQSGSIYFLDQHITCFCYGSAELLIPGSVACVTIEGNGEVSVEVVVAKRKVSEAA